MPDAPALHIDKLQFRYAHGDPLVIDIDAREVGSGEQVLLTGTSGRGKSTLLYLIAGLMEPTSGTVRVAGQDIHALAGHKRDQFRGSSIGMIFQTFNLLPGFSAAENVMLAMMFSDIPRGEHRDRALALRPVRQQFDAQDADFDRGLLADQFGEIRQRAEQRVSLNRQRPLGLREGQAVRGEDLRPLAGANGHRPTRCAARSCVP